MKIAGEYSYAVPKDVVWRAILDPEVLSRTLPGCEDLQKTGENQFGGKLKMKIGPVQGIFAGTVVLSELDPPNGYRMKIDGKGAPGFMSGDGRLELEEQDGGTLLRYEIEAKVGGRIASVGQRLLDSSAKVITKQGLTGLETQLEAFVARQSEESGGEEAVKSDDVAKAAPLPEAPSTTEFAGEFAKGLFDEMVPAKARPFLLVAVVLVVVAVTAVLLRSCS